MLDVDHDMGGCKTLFPLTLWLSWLRPTWHLHTETFILAYPGIQGSKAVSNCDCSFASIRPWRGAVALRSRQDGVAGKSCGACG